MENLSILREDKTKLEIKIRDLISEFCKKYEPVEIKGISVCNENNGYQRIFKTVSIEAEIKI